MQLDEAGKAAAALAANNWRTEPHLQEAACEARARVRLASCELGGADEETAEEAGLLLAGAKDVEAKDLARAELGPGRRPGALPAACRRVKPARQTLSRHLPLHVGFLLRQRCRGASTTMSRRTSCWWKLLCQTLLNKLWRVQSGCA